MPIIGVTDSPPTLKEIGRIRKGGPKRVIEKNGKEFEIMGEKIPEFRVTFHDDPDSQKARQRFIDAYNCSVTEGGILVYEINFFLAFPDVSLSWDASYEVYKKGGLVGKADGYRWLYLQDMETHTILIRDGVVLTDVNDERVIWDEELQTNIIPFDKDVPVYSYYSNSKSKDMPVFATPHGRLSVVIPELLTLKFLTLITYSFNDVIKISSQLNGIETFARQMGESIAGIQLVMTKELEEISIPMEGGGRAKRKEWIVNILLNDIEIPKLMPSLQFEQLPEKSTVGADDKRNKINAGADLPDSEKQDHIDETENSGEITSNHYWVFVYETLMWSPEAGKEVLARCDGDFAVALKLAKEQLPPTN